MLLRFGGRGRWLLWGAGALLAGALVVMLVMPAAVVVDLSTVTRASLRVTLDHEGKTRVHDRFLVSAPVAGRVLRIELRAGDSVKAGRTILATFAPAAPVPLDARSRAEARARVEAARASFEEARAVRDQSDVEARLARRELDRHRRLAREGIVAQDDLDATEAAARARDAALAAAESASAAARHDLEAAQASLLEPQTALEAEGWC